MWLICGPSSVGKSTFIESGKAAHFANLPNNTPTKFPVEFESDLFIPNSDFFLHYNILRPYHFIDNSTKYSDFVNRLKRFFFLEHHSSTEWEYIKSSWVYQKDTSWRNILNTKYAKKAIILVSTKNIIIERTKQRLIIENLHLTNTNQGKYPSSFWINLYNKIDLNDIYRIWCNELDQHGIDYICIDTSSGTYNLIDKQYLSSIINS